ncbi:hypothetical protein ACWENR_00475 [Micromonospora sp. NPDC004336]
MRPRMLAALAVADYRERVRRPGYLVVLLGAVGLGYLAAPATDTNWTIVNSGGYRGFYDSAYLGAVTALAGALWLSVGGFYVIRTAIAHDERTGVGQLLAATPLRTCGYLLGKFLSNLLVLGSMAATLVGTALALQWARGESLAVDPIALLLPFALFTLPVLAVTAAAAVVFETTPVLRTGFGNLVWFFLSMAAVVVGQSANAPLGGFGVHLFAAAMSDDLAARGVTATEFGLGLMYLDEPPRAIAWTGVDFTADFVGERLLLVLVAAAAATVPAVWFGRFDTARAVVPGAPAPAATAPVESLPAAYPVVSSPRTAARRGNAFGRLFAGELRILVRSVSWWWWLGVAVLVVGGLALPTGATRAVLVAAWIWPVLVWSRLGTHAREHGVDALLGACGAPAARVLAQWLAGFVLTALVGLGPAARMAAGGDLGGWLAGAAFIPALALALGVLGRTHRLFQAGYPPLWYAVANDIAGLDYMGVVAGGPGPVAVGAVAVLLLAVAVAAVVTREARR